MADYKIAPDSTGIISLGAMRKSLEASADYSAGSKHSTASTSVNTLVGSPVTYQSNVDSFTWSTTNPKGFNEMYGKTWSDGSGGGGGGGPTSYTLTLSTPSNGGDNCDRANVTIVQGGTTLATMSSPAGAAPSWNTSSVTVTDDSTVRITAADQGGGGAGCTSSYTQVQVRLNGTLRISIMDQTVVVGTSTSSTSAYYDFTPSANQTVSVTTTAVQGL